MKQIVVKFSVMGQFTQWPYFQKYCEKSISDSTEISVGIITKSITTEFGIYTVKFVLLFLGENISHHLKPAYQYTVDEVFKEGFDNLLTRLGKKTIVNIRLKQQQQNLKV